VSLSPAILVAEDDPNDIALLQRAFAVAANPICFVQDGDEAIAYLEGQGIFADRATYPMPWLLLLDLKMPRKNGFEVLKWVRAQSQLKSLRVVVLTSSDHMRDVDLAYKLGANSFLVKPVGKEEFARLVAGIRGYWIHASSNPTAFRYPSPFSDSATVEESSSSSASSK
jgi:CheY-like chemotaxis protein